MAPVHVRGKPDPLLVYAIDVSGVQLTRMEQGELAPGVTESNYGLKRPQVEHDR